MLDRFYIAIYNYYKPSLGKRSARLALIYINFLELSLLLVGTSFFKAFASQMHMTRIEASKFWLVFGLVGLIICFKNWIRFNGKKRTVLNAQRKGPKPSMYLLWFLPIACLGLAAIFLKVV